jgi:hypothetical protein
MRPPGCLPLFTLHRRRLLLPMLPSIQGIQIIQIIQPILSTRVVPTALPNRGHPTHHPRQLESLLHPPVSFTAKAHGQYPPPMIRFSRSIQDTPTIRPTLNTRITPTALLNLNRPMHNLEDRQGQL